MANKIKSALILLENVFNHDPKFNRKKLSEKLKIENLPFTDSTITRLLKFVEIEIGINIKSNSEGDYYVQEDDSDPNYLQIFHNYKGLYFRNIINHSLINNTILNQYISYSFETTNKNIEYINPLLTAIIQNNKIEIFYKKFKEEKNKKYIVNPLFIKEYLNRWYIIGNTETISCQVFALDRIENIHFLTSTFQKHTLFDTQIFKNTIGVNFSFEIQLVKLLVSNELIPYLETLPFHNSQKTIEMTESGKIISIEVGINYELERWILYYGSSIEVLEPQSLRNKIEKLLKSNLAVYQTFG